MKVEFCVISFPYDNRIKSCSFSSSVSELYALLGIPN